MQPIQPAQDDAYAEEVERYRAGGRKEKKHVPDSSVQQAAHLADKAGQFDPMAFLSDMPSTQQPASTGTINLDAELNPFFSATNRKPKDLTASNGSASSGNVRGGW
jgi:hypothetical protein